MTLAKELANAKVSTDSGKRGHAWPIKGNPVVAAMVDVSTCSAIVPPKYEGPAFMANVSGPPGSSALCAHCDELAHGFAGPCMQGRITNGLIPLGVWIAKICSGRGGLAFRYQSWEICEIPSSTLDEHGPTEGKQVAKHNPTTLTIDGVQNVIPWFPSY